MDDGAEISGGAGREGPLSVARKAALACLIGYDFLVVIVGLGRRRLPAFVRRLQRPPRIGVFRLDPTRLGLIVNRVLRIGRRRPRCIVSALVLLRMLCRQGTAAELVIGLPPDATSPEAHAWIEVDGRDVGPPPGRLGRKELARYGGAH